MGPGAGAEGGTIMFEGSYAELLKSNTLTGTMLNASKKLKDTFRTPNNWFALEHATTHNLKDVSVQLPLGVMTVIAGVAGSGKSSLMEAFRQQYPQQEDIVYISQKNIGISLRSTPATYMDVADELRKMFAKANKCKSELFSFNGKGGCPVCQGKGVIVSDMAFMDSIETVCEACGGLRYSNEVLQFKLKNLNIAQVMDLSAQKAYKLFAGTIIAEKLEPLIKTGLGYIHLNQSLSTLSGGELQRIKLASFLREKGKIFILDEPTDGLHLKDIDRLISLFDTMVSAGNTIFLIEHNLEVLKSSDYVIEIGPGGGHKGGEVIFTGTPAQMQGAKYSVTAPYLK
jgi:excinuclease ABC A subunit